MKPTRLFLSLVVISVFAFSCGKKIIKNPEKIKTVVWTPEKDKSLKDMTEVIKFIPLNKDNVAEGMLSEISNIIIKNDRVYAFDFSFTFKVAVYDLDGNFLFTPGKIGRGPGEYTRLRGFTVDDNNIYLFTFNKEVLVFDLSGNYLQTKYLNFHGESIAQLDNGNFMFYENDYEADKSIIKFTNSDFEVTSQWESNWGFRSELRSMNYFSVNPGFIIYGEPMQNIVYEFTNSGHLSDSLKFDFGSKSLTERQFDKVSDWVGKEESKNYVYLSSVPYKIGEWYAGNVVNEGILKSYIISPDNKIYVSKVFKSDDFLNIIGTYNSMLIGLTMWPLPAQGVMDDLLCQHIENGNFVVSLIKIKD